MSITRELQNRSGNQCELCSTDVELSTYLVPPKTKELSEYQIAICSTCLDQITGDQAINADHWRCLNESMWSETPAVQVMAYRMLKRLSSNDWADDLLNMLYLDDETMAWAQEDSSENAMVHKDSNGQVLEAGDTVVLIKDLNVKGAGFTAKRGTAVRRISLDMDNPNHIEGRVNDQHIVILTQYVKKSK